MRTTLRVLTFVAVAIRHILRGRDAWDSSQPGMVLPVRVDRAHPDNVAVDPA
ncbi:hypothetical protein GCM10009682_24490 [Luedemannella flava]|uniref:Uncharacterized protein n=1 Tax=Luedemannella flava TaxID=349316 RepID=A0ABP4YAE1_9ACTN